MEPLLAVQNVTKIFPSSSKDDYRVLDDISFTIHAGEVVGLVGPSGSGKSTIAKLISRLTNVTAGSISFQGNDVTYWQGKKLRRLYDDVQMVFQMPQTTFDPRKTLGEGISESLRNRGMSRPERQQKVRDLLMKCGLDASFANRYPRDVSGGQCQRASIARALAIGPRLLICDEATSSLDVTLQAQIIDLLKTLQADMNMACLFITHNLALAEGFCDRLLVLRDGKIIESGRTEDVLFHPLNAYTKALVAAAL